MIQSDERKKARGITKWMLRHYREICRAVMDTRATMVATRVGGNGSGIAVMSDPTAQAAIKNLTPLQCVILDAGDKVLHPELWIASIAAGYDNCDDDERRMIESVYAGNAVADVAERNSVDQSVIYRLLGEMVNVVMSIAAYHRLVKPF